MTTKSIPPALEPYLRLPPEASLILLTGTLACSVNWLTCRFIATALSQPPSEDEPESRRPVVLISWLRDPAWWKTEMKRTTGLDLSRFQKEFTYIPALSPTNPLPSTLPTTPLAPFLILDTPFPFPHTPNLLSLRSQAHATILSTHADIPLLSPSTPLDTSAANFLIGAAHSARMVMGVRELETGAARDVSGVLRVTRGGSWEGGEEQGEVEEREMLYFVGRDGNVKVFNRGEE